METSIWEGSPFDAPSGPVAAEIPSVVAVVVTSDPGDRFDAVLAGLAAQDYPSLTVLVVDVASRDDPSPRIGAVLPDAYIRRIAEPTTFAAAANEALTAVEGANYLLFLAEDVELGEDAISLLVEEAVRSNAGVVGPKLVDAQRREVLLQIGLAADKIGVPSDIVDVGEIDHEQHDAVRDVFAVPHAAMLVRADLLSELGGFDADFSMGVEEIDLCWRARLVGARVMVVPDAVASRPIGALEERFGSDPDLARREEPTHRLRMLVRNYSVWSLVRVLPQAAVVTAVQAAGLLAMGRGARSSAVIRAWTRNVARLRATLYERRSTQRQRAIGDREIRALQVRGFSYVRAFLAGQLDLGRRVEALGGAGRDLAEQVTLGARRPSIVFGAVLTALVLFGSRALVADGVPAVGSFLPWPDTASAFRELTSAWRFVGAGSGGPAPPVLAVMGGLSALLGGSEGLARTLVVVGAIPLGAFGAFRLMLPLARSVWPPLAAATAYAVVPLPRNAIAAGRIGPLVFYALAPFLLSRILRASGVEPFGQPGDGRPARDPARAALSLALLTALAAAFFPIAVVLVLAAALALLIAAPLAGDRVAALRGLAWGSAGAGIAVALLFPWSVGLLVPTPDPNGLGLAFLDRPGFADALLFDTGPARVGVAGLLLLVAAQPLVIGSGDRLRWAVRAWVLALAGWVLTWLPGQVGAGVGTAPAEGPLVLAALGVAMGVGLGSGVLREELQREGLSWRQGVALAGIGALGVVTLPLLGDAFDGRWDLPPRDWSQTLSWMESERADGGFRVLWLGDPDHVPLPPSRLGDGTAFGMTRGATGTGLDLHPLPAEGATAQVARGVEAALEQRTDRLGHLLGPHAVRYVAVPSRAAPGITEDRPEDAPPSELVASLSRQVDLSELVGLDPGIRLYENDAWMPAAALVTGDLAEAVAESGGEDAIRLDLSGARPVGGVPRGSGEVRLPSEARDRVEGTLVLAEAYDRSWEATAGGALRPHLRAFGTLNAFRIEDVDRVSVSVGGQWLRYGALGVEAAILALVLVAWSRRRTVERTRRHAHAEAERDVRPRSAAPAEEVPA